jgi:hypothetical protein
MNALQDLTRSLLAAGVKGSDDPDEVTYLYEEDGDLMEKQWADSEVVDQTSISSDVRSDTAAAHLMGTTGKASNSTLLLTCTRANFRQGLIFYIDINNVIKGVKYNEEDGAWEEADLGEAANVVAHEKSGLATYLCHSKAGLFFQDPAGSVVGIINRGGSWKLDDKLSAKAVVGTPLSTTSKGDKLYVFYVGEDNSIHYHVRENGGWKGGSPTVDKRETCTHTSLGADYTVGNSTFPSVKRIVTAEDPESEAFEVYVLSEGRVWLIAGSDRKELGKVEGGKLVALTTAQRTIRVRWTKGRGRPKKVEIGVRHIDFSW